MQPHAPPDDAARRGKATPEVERSMGLGQAVASNMLVMIGVGPFLTLPEMVNKQGGPHILYAWLIGAVLALCDGLVYAQFAAALPGSGGPYLYLREAYAPLGVGRPLAFAYLFQLVFTAPLSIAGGAVGFANYLGYFWPSMGPSAHHAVAAALCLVMTALLYRDTASVGRLSVVMLAVVLLTVGWVIVAGAFSFSWARAFDFPPAARRLDGDLASRTGAVALLAMYNYGGYNTVCGIGGEVRSPHKTLPRAVLLSVAAVVAIYVAMSTVVLGTIPWPEIARSTTIAPVFVAHTIADPRLGRVAARVMNGLVLFVTATSLYGLILGYSRVPYAAARDGQFFRVFGRLHPTKRFPHVSLVVLGLTSLPFCFLPLGALLTWPILVQTLMQSIWLCAGVVIFAVRRRDLPQPFRMWLFPLPAIVALVMWCYVFSSADWHGVLFTFAFFAVAIVAYAAFVRSTRAPPAPVGPG